MNTIYEILQINYLLQEQIIDSKFNIEQEVKYKEAIIYNLNIN